MGYTGKNFFHNFILNKKNMKPGHYISVLFLINTLMLSGQVTGPVSAPERMDRLGAEDLLFRNDTVEINVISAQKVSESCLSQFM